MRSEQHSITENDLEELADIVCQRSRTREEPTNLIKSNIGSNALENQTIKERMSHLVLSKILQLLDEQPSGLYTLML